MKRTFPLLALFIGLAAYDAQAQMADRLNPVPAAVRPPGVATAAEVTREMTNRLHLNEAQYLQLLPINRIRLVRQNSINRLYKNDEANRTAKLAELDVFYEKECSQILTPTQLSQLQQNQKPATEPATDGNGLG